MNKIKTIQRKEDNNIYFSDFIKTILPYKWSIFLIILIFLLLTSIYLYFTAPIYESSATIKIKTEKSLDKLVLQDPIHSALSQSKATNIEQEMAILKSFYINNKVIEKLNMEVEYFTKKGYKKIKIFENPPIKIQNIVISNHKIVGVEFILYPEGDGFRIKPKDKPTSRLFQYNQEIVLADFKCIIKKEANFNSPIYFKLNGNNRDIYENIVKQRLKISKLGIDISIIKLSYQDNSIKRANSYINELMNIYLAQSVIEKNRENSKILNFINKELETTGGKLQKLETELQEYKVSNKVIEPTQQSKLLLDRLNSIEIDIEKSKIRQSLAKNLVTVVKKGQYVNMIPTLRALDEYPTIELIQKIENMKQRIATLRVEFTNKYPDIVKLRKEIQKSKYKVYGNIQNIQSTINQRIKSLYRQKKENEIKLKKLPLKEKQLIQFQRRYDVTAKMYAYLLEKKSENDLKRVATMSDYDIIDSAYSSNTPIKPKKTMLLIASGLMGMILGIFIAYLQSRLNRKIQTIKDIQELTTLPICAKIPMVSKRDIALEVLKYPNSILSTYFRKLRTKLQLIANKSKGNSLLITSSMPNEGKTEVILNLAHLFQLAEYKSVIIDLDLYQPSLHKYFNVNSNKGISTYLNHRNSIEDITLRTEYPYLDVILAGENIQNPSELLLSQKLTLLLSTLAEKYEYIFINSAPLMIVEEPLYLMQFTDINMIIMRENFTKKSFLNNFNKTLQEYDFKNICLIFNTKHK